MSEQIVSGSLISVTAKFACGGCGKHFDVDVETSSEVPQGWSIFDAAVDGVRAEYGPSLQGGHILCRKCTTIVDNAVPEDRLATETETRRALERAHNV